MSTTPPKQYDEEEQVPAEQISQFLITHTEQQKTERCKLSNVNELLEHTVLSSVKTSQKSKNILSLRSRTNCINSNKVGEHRRLLQLLEDEDNLSVDSSSTGTTYNQKTQFTEKERLPSLKDTVKENQETCSHEHLKSFGTRIPIDSDTEHQHSKLALSPLTEISINRANNIGRFGTVTKRQADNCLPSQRPEDKPKKLRIMSLYERQYLQNTDDRPISNGYLSARNSSTGHNNENNANNYYPSSGTSAANGGNNALIHAPSMASLCNIGNTCYLNSVVYTLRFAPLFLHNLHHLVVELASIQQNIVKHRTKSSSLGRNVSGAHLENGRSWSSKDLVSLENYGQCDTQKSSQQIATEKLHELYQNLHRNEVSETTEPFHADTFLHAIQDVSAIFEGNQQQDAHEFLMCVLDSIRETCQSLIKVIADCPDIIINGCVSLPEQASESSVEQNNINHNSNGSSSGTKSSSSSNLMPLFFSRKSKRKDEAKNLKNKRLQSPLKDNIQPQPQNTQHQQSVTLNSSVFVNSTNDGMNTKTSPTVEEDCLSLKDKERLAEKIKKLGLDFFTEDFEGMTVSTTKCLSCETVTEQKETMIDIAVPVPISGYTETSNSFIQNACITREYFRDKNKYRCEQCTGYTEAIRSISYELLPRLLVIQLSRFSGGMEKINSYIPTPFTMQCFCAKCEQLESNNKLHAYKLYSVITHVGATMSVGHYIAYTCSLDYANEYVNCPKDKRRQQTNSSSPNNNATASSARSQPSSSSSSSSGTRLMKKVKFVRNKASSSGDMSKSIIKNINGLTSKSITNGIEKLSVNTACQSIDCCASLIRGSTLGGRHLNHNSTNNYTNGLTTNGAWSDLVDDANSHAQVNGFHNSNYNYLPGYGSTGRSKSGSSSNNNAEPIWYMCDDDKIKAMTQREFEELLSPTRKITVTPYLLFYARFDLQQHSSTTTMTDCGI